MPRDLKYGEITMQHGDVPGDEPLFIFRGRDALALGAIKAYRETCADAGRPPWHLEMIDRNYEFIAAWQAEHPDRVRLPDSESSRERLT